VVRHAAATAKKCNCGAHFDAWFRRCCELGYEGRIVYFNSQFALPTPQSRDRMYVVFWRKGLPGAGLDFRPPSWCSDCETIVRGVQTWKTPSRGSLRAQPGKYEWGRYGAQYTYTCPNEAARARSRRRSPGSKAIDWTIPAERIGDRAKPLAPKTRARIKTGLERLATTEPVQVQVGGNLYERPGYARVWSVDDPLRTVTGTPYMGLVVASPRQARHAIIARPRSRWAHDHRPDRISASSPCAPAASRGRQGRPSTSRCNTITAHDRQMASWCRTWSTTRPRRVDEPMPRRSRPAATHARAGRARREVEGREPHPRRRAPMPTVAGHGESASSRCATTAASSLATSRRHRVGGGYHHGLLVYNGTRVRARRDEPAGTVTTATSRALPRAVLQHGVAAPTTSRWARSRARTARRSSSPRTTSTRACSGCCSGRSCCARR
jgi:site-specific DNA-cytosine methylase